MSMSTIKGGYSAGFSGTVRVAPDLPEIKAYCIIDSHMHIQSNNCAPAPLKINQLKRQNYFIVAAHLIPVTVYSSVGFGGGLGLGAKSEDKIGLSPLMSAGERIKK